jgi:hypothetical protein
LRQVQLGLARVGLGGDGRGESAAVERLQDRRLDLEEVARVEPAADRGDHLRAQDEQLARVLVGDQIELAPPIAGLDVLEPMELVRRRQQRLREQRPTGRAQRQLAAARLEGCAVDPDQVAEVERRQRVERLLSQHVPLRLDLDPPRAVDDVEESLAPMPSPRRQPARDAIRGIGLGPILQIPVRLAHDFGGDYAWVGMRERIHALRTQALQFLTPVVAHSWGTLRKRPRAASVRQPQFL